MFWPGPNYGIDFKGGTEIELEFKGDVSAAELRKAVIELGYDRPRWSASQGQKNRFIVRVQEVSSLPDAAGRERSRSASTATLGDGQARRA